jgi:uncharacterized protein YbcI
MSLDSMAVEDRPASVGAEISTLIVQTLHEYSGRGPTKAHTTIGRNVIHTILGDTLTKAERTLADAGYEDEVLTGRKRMQAVMRPHLVIEVEKLVERKVIAFMSDNHIGPDFAVETFVLAPEEGDGGVVSGDGAVASEPAL